MLQLSSIFSGINEEAGIFDVQTALGSQGFNLDEGVSIPIYDIFYLKIAGGCNPGILCSDLQQYNALDKLNDACGSIACTINLFEMDLLTLIGAIGCYIPSSLKNGGMYIFIKDNIPDLTKITEDIAVAILNLSGAKIEDLGASTMNIDVAVKALDILIKLLIKMLNTDMSTYGIQVYDFDRLPEFMQYLHDSGDYNQMYQYRKQNNLIHPNANKMLGGGSAFGGIGAFNQLYGGQ